MNKDIENLKSIIDDLEDADDGAMINLSKKEVKSLRNIIKLLEKQQREIKGKEAVIDTLEHNDIVYQDIIREYEKDFISKDKIREKIKELNVVRLCGDNFYKLITEDKIKLLEKLLEEDE